MTAAGVVDLLYEAHVIDSKWKMRVVLRTSGFSHRLQPGTDGLAGIATYFAKQIEDRQRKKNARRWMASKNLTQPVTRSRDAKMTNSRVRRIAYDFKNEAKPIMEKLYPGCILQDVQVRYSDVIDGVYIRCVLRKYKEGDYDKKGT